MTDGPRRETIPGVIRGWARRLLLVRHVAAFAAIALGALLLSLAAAAYPLFLSATSSNLVRGAVEGPSVSRYGAGLTYTFRDLPFTPVHLAIPFTIQQPGQLRSPRPTELDEPFRRLAGASEVLGEPVRTTLGDPLSISYRGVTGAQLGRLFGSTGVLDQVERVAGSEGEGVWLPDLIADELNVLPGDAVRLRDPDGGPAVAVPVDGIYRGIYTFPSGGYWQQWQTEFRVPCEDCGPLPQPILVDGDVLPLLRSLDQASATFRWTAPLTDPAITLQQANALEHRVDTVLKTISLPDGQLGRVFDCCHRYFWFDRRSGASGATTSVLSSAAIYVAREAETRIVAIQGPARTLEMAAIGVAIIVVGAAGAFSVWGRRVEAGWFFVHGRSAAFIGLKTVAETIMPFALGGLLGLWLASAIVGAFGPNAPIDPSASVDATRAVALASLSGVLVTGLAAAGAYVRLVDPHGRGRLREAISRVPWEVAVIALAALAWRHLRVAGGFVVDERLDVVRPSLALIGFPFLLIAGCGALGARLARLGFVWLRRSTTSASAPVYLATRRLAGGGALPMLLIASTALCLGTFIHAQVMAQSLQDTVEAKAKVFVGSDVSASVIADAAPEGFPFPVTRVVQVSEGLRLPSGRSIDVLAIDPASFARAAYWNDAFGDLSLDAMLDRIRAPASGSLPMILAAGSGLDVEQVTLGTTAIPVEVVARPIAFPGLLSERPLAVVAESNLTQILGTPDDPLARSGAELWIRGEPDGIQAALDRLAHPAFSTVTAEQVQDLPAVTAAIDTFLAVNALGIVSALLAVVGLVLYLQTRQRSEAVSYALATRMGMSAGAHRHALLLEIGAMVGVAFTLGVGFALIAGGFTVPRVDPIATIPPAPFVVAPIAWIAGAAGLFALLTWCAAAITDRTAAAADLGVLMRVAE